MATKVLLVDQDIDFAVGIKRALEQSSGYRVTAFVNGQAAIELVRAEPQDLAILDFEPGDIDIVALITALRAIQPTLFILVSPRTEAQIVRARALNVQGSITKPYLARQLIPVMREALAVRARLPKPSRATPPASPVPAPHEVPIAPVSPEFDAVLAELTPPTTESSAQTDDPFRQQIAALQRDKMATPAGLRKTLENFTVPPAEDNVTLGESVNVVPQPTPPVALSEFPIPPESPTDEPSFIAAIAPLFAQPAPPPVPASHEPEEPSANPGTGTLLSMSEYDALTTAASTSEANETERLASASSAPEVSETPRDEDDTPILWAAAKTGQFPAVDSTADKAVGEPASVVANAIEVPGADPAAEAAAKLTHLAIGSAVRATILTRAGVLVAAVGDLSTRAVAGVVEVIVQVWQTSDVDDEPDKTVPRLRYIQVPGVGDFMLYSTRSIGELCLSILFPSEMSLRLIRQQARKLIDALEGDTFAAQVDQDQLPSPGPDEPEAAQTLVLRPTEPRPPEGLHGAISGDPSDDTPASVLANVNYIPYTLLWLPRAESLPPDVGFHLSDWIQDAAAAHAWRVQESTASAGCVTVRIDLPTDQLPGQAIDILQRATAEQAAQAELWDNAYYIIASERAVTPQEIEQFVSYQRTADAN